MTVSDFIDNYLIVSFDLSEDSEEYAEIERKLKDLGFKNNSDDSDIPYNVFVCEVNNGDHKLTTTESQAKSILSASTTLTRKIIARSSMYIH